MPPDATALTAPAALKRLRELPDTPVLPPPQEWVFCLESQADLPLVWIGKTQGPLREYLCSAQARCPVPLRLTAVFSAPRGTKALIHAKFRAERSHSEWFVLTTDLARFVAALPKGQTLPAATVERWANEIRPIFGTISSP